MLTANPGGRPFVNRDKYRLKTEARNESRGEIFLRNMTVQST